MTLQEFSTEFDVLYNNITSNQAPGLNEYEKSVFLTKAQNQLVNEYFNVRSDGFGGGFDGSQKRQYDFSSLIRVDNLFNINTFKTRVNDNEKIDRRSEVYLFPKNYFLSVNEIISDDKWQYSVLPLNYAEYQRLMLKPYAFPVKRGVWRLLTDKKNCNYVHYDPNWNEIGDVTVNSDYSLLSSWADQRRNLKVTINTHTDWNEQAWGDIADNKERLAFGDTMMAFTHTIGNDTSKVYITGSRGWENNNTTYHVTLNVYTSNPDLRDDESTIELLKEGFRRAKKWSLLNDTSYTMTKICQHVDGFQMASAPSKFTNFVCIFDPVENQYVGGKTFTTKVIQLPMAEVIGKFTMPIQYQLRYIRNLNPIILDDLDDYGQDLSIGGSTSAMNCELPEETHQEILERAVTLAKIAWQGGTMTQAQAQQNNRNQ